MKWMSSVVDGCKGVGTGLSQGASWVWRHTPVTSLGIGTVTYAANTFFETLKQGLALRTALPSLYYGGQSRKILGGMAHVVFYDVLPLVCLNYANNKMQSYFRDGVADDSYYTAYSTFLGLLTIADYGVRAYTWRQGIQTSMHTAVLISVGPSAFKANSKIPPLPVCEENECNSKRTFKGFLREPIILIANDAAVKAMSSFPYAGPEIAKVMELFFNGRFIARAATSELCERHKLQFLMKETTLALGLTYALTSGLMEYTLESTVGMPPYLYLRTLRHLLLLLHINVAAHMSFSLIKPDEATLRYDPLDVYESAIRFLSDVVFAGLVKRIPIDFAPVKGAPPLIPLVPALKWLTTLFNADLITENQRQPDFLSHQLHQMKVWCLPPILHDTNGLIRDPINGKYWTEIRSGILSTIGTLESFGKANTANALATVPKLTARVLFSVYGIPKKLTKAFFIVVQVEEFWSMITALKDWVDRHNVALKVELISNPDATPLHGKLLVLTTPKSDGVQQVAEAKVLQTKIREKKTIVNPEQLISSRRQEDGRVTVSAHSLFSRRRPVIKIEEAQSDNNLGQH